MSVQIKIKLSPGAQGILAKLPTLPPRILLAVAAGMNEANQYAIATIQRDHLTGTGPFPPEQHKLGVVTNRLRNSVNATSATITGQTVNSSIGSNVIYAAIHEFGGRIHHEARQTKVRLRTDARGALVRQLGNLAMFARKDHKRAREVTASVPAHDVTIPERAPFRTGIQESADTYTKRISAAIVREWNQTP